MEGSGRKEEGFRSTGSSSSAPCSPRSKIKVLCSHGGKILPRPADGRLKYVGGETRVLSISRDIKFPELIKKLSGLSEGEVILKYQLIPEDLDALISVKSDEDLRHMLDEYDRHETSGTPRLRAFLFPVNPVIIESQIGSQEPLEQRYIDAINGIVRPPPLRPIAMSYASYNISSACSPPKSPESCATDTTTQETMIWNPFPEGRPRMPRVESSPTIYNPNVPSNGSTYHHHRYQNQKSTGSNYHHKRPLPYDPYRNGYPERLMKVKSVGRADSAKYQVDQWPGSLYPASRFNRDNGYSNYDDFGANIERKPEKPVSLPHSPSFQSPRRSYFSIRTWDSSGDT